jgi:predicted secreted protein
VRAPLAVAIALALAVPSSASALAPVAAPFTGRNADDFAVHFRVAKDRVRKFATLVERPSCAGDGDIRFTADRLPIGKDRRFSTTGTTELSDGGGTATIKLTGRFDKRGVIASGQIDTDVDLGVTEQPGGSVGGGCEESVPFTTRAYRRLDESPRTQSVTLRRGMDLELRLSGASGSTGYHWDVTRKPSGEILAGPERSVRPEHSCPELAVGCPEDSVFRYRAIGNGRTRLRLALRPPGDQKPVRELTVKVRVTRTA